MPSAALRLAFVYPWATFGGCERVLLNRAVAFQSYLPDVELDFCFLHDAGGLGAFIAALSHYDIDQNIEVSNSLKKTYDLISLIDCPQAFRVCEGKSGRCIVECHSPYRENRRYLNALPRSCAQVVTPSRFFSELIRKEFPGIPCGISELRNFVPWDSTAQLPVAGSCLPSWRRTPILFFGRLDSLKNPLALLDAFQILERRRPGELILVFCGPPTDEIKIHEEIAKRSMAAVSVVLPPIPFASAELLFRSVAEAGGLFVSPSKGESFGLSAAEAIACLVPVVLSDIGPHKSLVADYESMFTYPSGSIEKLAARIEGVLSDYTKARNAMGRLRERFSASAFIADWRALLEKLAI